MNRNTQEHFAQLPTVDIGRSKFDRGFTHTTTFNTGELVPVYVDPDIVPGDTVSMKQSEIIRMTTPICPVMDNAYMDFYWFFVPNRLVMTDWKKLMGENETAPWTQTVDVTVPQIRITNDARQNISGTYYVTRNVRKGSVLDYMGIPTQNSWEYAEAGTEGSKEIQISALPVRAYCAVWNEFFRDENLQNPVRVSKDNTNRYIVNYYNAGYRADPDANTVIYEECGGLPCLKVCKPHDYFTSALPEAQKGPAVSLPLAGEALPIRYKNENTGEPDRTWADQIAYFSATSNYENENSEGTALNSYPNAYTVLTDPTKVSPTGNYTGAAGKDNFSLYADLTAATGATVNALRQAFAIQKFYERDARGGWANA